METSKDTQVSMSAEETIPEIPTPAPNKVVPEILKYPDPRLFEVAKPFVCEWDKGEEHLRIIRLFNGLRQALILAPYGDKLGLALPQIGVLERGFIFDNIACVNPQWSPVSNAPMAETFEGCYSLDRGTYFKKPRPPYGWAEWTNPLTGEVTKKKLNGLQALIFQHELDHLNGSLLKYATMYEKIDGVLQEKQMPFNLENGQSL